VPVSKKELATNISKKLSLRNNLSLEIVSIFFKFLRKNHKQNINIHNFGSFSYRPSPERIGRNPKTLQKFKIKARKKLSFQPSHTIKQNLN
jgi:integration host factor subunit alpha|tara:strand:- start:734 stop:1006 length:273 start_codon:yes stop_codon:yes gene_type:complete